MYDQKIADRINKIAADKAATIHYYQKVHCSSTRVDGAQTDHDRLLLTARVNNTPTDYYL